MPKGMKKAEVLEKAFKTKRAWRFHEKNPGTGKTLGHQRKRGDAKERQAHQVWLARSESPASEGGKVGG